MSAKTRIFKKVRKEIRSQKPRLIRQISKEVMTAPLRERLKAAWRLIFEGRAA